MVMVIVRHAFKDFNAFSSGVVDWYFTLKPGKEYKYIRTYCALPVKNEARCIWDIANPMAIADFQREAQPPKKYLFSFLVCNPCFCFITLKYHSHEFRVVATLIV